MNRHFSTRVLAHILILALAYTPILGSLNCSVALAQTQNTTTSYLYDSLGNDTKITDPLGHITTPSYDALNRVNQLLQPAPASGQARPTIVYTYDGLDRPATVKDPRNLTTTYTVDGLGDQLGLASPDTGGSSQTYDLAGNVVTSTDARGKTTSYTYDALNRVTSISYAGGTPTLFEYDGGSSGAPSDVGHLTTMTDDSGHTGYAFDGLGRLTAKTQTVVVNGSTVSLAVAYEYGSVGSMKGKLASVTYPSGHRVLYGYDAAGRIASMTASLAEQPGTSVPLLTEIGYAPLGGVQSWKWGNDSPTHPNSYARSYDLDGRVTGYPLGNPAQNGLQRTLAYDAASRITSITHTGNGTGSFAPANFNQSFGYDDLDRITTVASNTSPALAYSYDATGNRTQTTAGAAAYNYAISASSNRLTGTAGPAPAYSNAFDAAGNTTGDGTVGYTYSERGRLQSVSKAGATVSYLYNGMGQRVAKSGVPVSGGANLYAYDEQGHLLGEYDVGGHAVQETVYLGELPIAVLTMQVPTPATPPVPPPGVTSVYYAYQDHIATPRLLVSAIDDTVVWRWDVADPFGAQGANEDPSGTGAFVYNPRFPGQYYDRETGLHYNYFRDYDPQTGRYIQSDPIGLDGGINTFGYVDGNPISHVDPFGQFVIPVPALIVGTIVIIWAITHPIKPPTVSGPIFSKPPENARDPDGPKAPGKPGEEDGFRDPKNGENWVPNPNPGSGGSNNGWQDSKGDVWCPTGQGGRSHGGPHWDVQSPGGGYRNVKPQRK